MNPVNQTRAPSPKRFGLVTGLFCLVSAACSVDSDGPVGGPADFRPQPIPEDESVVALDTESLRFSTGPDPLQLSGTIVSNAPDQPPVPTQMRLLDISTGISLETTATNDTFTFAPLQGSGQWLLDFPTVKARDFLIANAAGVGEVVSGCLSLWQAEPALRHTGVPPLNVGESRTLAVDLYNLCDAPVHVRGVRAFADTVLDGSISEFEVDGQRTLRIPIKRTSAGDYRAVLVFDTDASALPFVLYGSAE